MDQDKVVAVRTEFKTLLDERDVTKARSSKAQAAISAATSWNNAVDGLSELADEDESVDPTIFPTKIDDPEFLGWLKGVATSSGATETSTKLAELQKRLSTWIQVADDLDIPDEEQVAINALLNRYGSSGSSASRQPRAGGELSKTEQSRHLNGVPLVAWTNSQDGTSGEIKAGARNNEGDWVSARYEMKKLVDKRADVIGIDAKSAWTNFTSQLSPVRDGLLGVDAGDGPFELEVTEPQTGFTFHISYSG